MSDSGLHYRYSLKMEVPASEFLEESLKELNELSELLGSGFTEDYVNMNQMFKLLQENKKYKTIIHKNGLGEVDLELRDSNIYLHVFDSIKPAQLWLLEDSVMNCSIDWYKHYNLVRIIEEGVEPMQEEQVKCLKKSAE
ncbi:hypothetical protein COX58_02315 [archaeon CG_4_10_14_0_2_um_filter_Archaea_38_6]|nr:MAG: hypothetical protein COS83_01580 [archaeon CG07_land_8_20_14_0_80_38_8]PIX42473.1 MAG: hypothetical protein COZ55_02085 [archaeon CG_4_8_14_3_um_filter_38_5]PJA22418.1 MAG: hypothetical protein COX58_02315 [archaeon CG_4_10_14_0_2_um_filter_Archaea_38_6]